MCVPFSEPKWRPAAATDDVLKAMYGLFNCEPKWQPSLAMCADSNWSQNGSLGFGLPACSVAEQMSSRFSARLRNKSFLCSSSLRIQKYKPINK
uniref:Uncharacterized protein n=1 Tax=Anguilla anguilla TaxID=7936 RepID=A0A0E9Q8Z1_ANGAN